MDMEQNYVTITLYIDCIVFSRYRFLNKNSKRPSQLVRRLAMFVQYLAIYMLETVQDRDY